MDVGRPGTIKGGLAKDNERSGDGSTHNPEEIHSQVRVDPQVPYYEPISPGPVVVQPDGRDTGDTHIQESAGIAYIVFACVLEYIFQH